MATPRTSEALELCMQAALRGESIIGMPLLFDSPFGRPRERWPHVVVYDGTGKPVHVTPDSFGWSGSNPSASEWIVPGTMP